MKLGIVIPCYNRPEYLRQCMDSIEAASIPEGTYIVLYDDHSSNKDVGNILMNIAPKCDFLTGRNNINIGVCGTLISMIRQCMLAGCDIIMNLDSDAIVRPDFIEKILALKERFPDKIVTGFNCLTKNTNGTERHPIIEQGEGYNIKSSVGGLNMCFNREQYKKWILPALEKGMKRLVNWDAEACKNSGGAVCVVPSVVQHIGLVSSMGHSHGNEPVDVAYDFVMEEMPHIEYKVEGYTVTATTNISLIPAEPYNGTNGTLIYEPDHIFLRGQKIFYSDHPEWWAKVSRNEWEPETFDVLDKEIKPGKVFIDIGAWNGLISLYAAKLGAKCYAVEPDKGIHKTLEENIQLNNADISIHKLAIGNVNGAIELNAKGEFGDSESSLVVRFGRYTEIETVECQTLEGFIADNGIGISEVCLIKIDIEAGEVLMLPEAVEYLEKHKPNIYIAFHPAWFPDLENNVKMIAELLSPIYDFIGMNGNTYSKAEFVGAMHSGHDHAFLLKSNSKDDFVMEEKGQIGSTPREYAHTLAQSGTNEDLEVEKDTRLHLPSVTLVTVNCDKIDTGITAIQECTRGIKFGAVKFLSSTDLDVPDLVKIPHLNNIQDYSRFIAKELYKYIDTDFVLIVQSDGYVKNPAAWDSAFLQFDYIGATWWYKDGMNVGNGGFSLRSKKLLQILGTDPQIKLTHPEDHHICRTYRRYLQRAHGIRFASEEAARKFSIEGYGRQDKKYWTNEFGFHGFPALGKVETKPDPILQKMATVSKKEIVESNKGWNEILIINQPFGLGDYLFIIPLLREFISQGHKVIVPVVSQYTDIGRHFPEITFIDKDILNIDIERKDEYHLNGATVIPLRFADGILKLPFTECMKSKYLYFGKDWNDWRKCTWARDTAKENDLFYNMLGLNDGEEYTLINQTFRSNSTGKVNIHTSGVSKKVFLKAIPGFALLDWGKVIENASSIHTVSTAILYMLELMTLSAKDIHLYCRRPDERDFKNVDYLFSKRYRLHL